MYADLPRQLQLAGEETKQRLDQSLKQLYSPALGRLGFCFCFCFFMRIIISRRNIVPPSTLTQHVSENSKLEGHFTRFVIEVVSPKGAYGARMLGTPTRTQNRYRQTSRSQIRSNPPCDTSARLAA